MDKIIKSQLRETIEALKNKVNHNLIIIRENELIIRNILKEKVTNQRSEKLNYWFGINKKLMDENRDSLNMQLSILKYLNKQREEIPEPILEKVKKMTTKDEPEYIPLNPDHYLQLTIENAILYNEEHPYFENEEFASDLISHYLMAEEYDTCAQIKNRRDKHNNFLFSLN